MRLLRSLLSLRHPLAWLLPFLLATFASAQSVRWTDAGSPGAVALVFENCAPEGQPELPAIPGVTFSFVGRSESMNMINFQTSRSVTLSYLVRGRAGVPLSIPAFTVKTDKGPQRVDAFSASPPAAPLDTVASARLLPERPSVWAGEVFSLNYELSASRRANPQISPTFDWNAAPLVAEDWSKPEVTETTSAGDRRINVLFRTRAAAKAPNTLRLDAASHLLSIQTGTIGFGILSQPRMEQVTVTSDQPTLEIRPLPPAPAGFNGAVGQFKLVSKVVPEKAAVGEPVTWTLELTGTGNWPDFPGLPARDVSNDFKVVQPKAKRTPAEAKLFDTTLTEDVVLVPSKAGTYTLGPVNFVYFDPKAGAYKTVTSPRAQVIIAPPGAPQFNITTTPAAPEADARPRTPPAAPAAPTAIPRDPLPGSAATGVPLSTRALLLWLLAPLALLLGLWLWLAVRRARLTDPAHPRREAHQRLARLLAEMPPAGSPALLPHLLHWQRDTATLWQIPHAAPAASLLPDSAWATLWAEADRALYGIRPDLPSDWTARAQHALASLRLPRFQPLRLFLPRNLMPFAALLALTLALGPVWLHAAATSTTPDALAAYRQGDFPAAEKRWRAALDQQPTDWIAHHNLALALAQQNRSGEAAAHAAAAFVQQPSHPSVRWHFDLAAGKAGASPLTLSAFLNPDARHALARLASPVAWQRALLLSAWLAAAALGWLLWNAYGPRRRACHLISLSLVGTSLALAALAATGLSAYGHAADARAVLVARSGVLRSIPTEADTAQKTSPLALGTLALADRTFLGWTQLTFDNGQTGWVRKEDLVPLWR